MMKGKVIKIMEEINVNEIVEIKQLPEIYQQLDKVNQIVIDKTKDIDDILNEISKLSDDEQENKKQEIKKYKTYLNSMKNDLETKRKEVKKAIQKPYEEFESVYKDKALNVLDDGISKLTNTINTIETKQLSKKVDELNTFFNEYALYYHIEDIITFDSLPININLSTSLNNLKKQIQEYCEKVSNDMIAISSEEFKDEILLEYKNNGYDYTKAKINVIDRHKKLEEIQKQQEKAELEVSEEEKVIQNVQTLCSAPVELNEEIDDENDLEISFTIKTTKEIYQKLLKDKLQEFKQFLQENNIKYE